MSLKIPIAWNNTLQNKRRTIAAIGGISFSLLLILMQLGFLATARITSSLVYDFFDFDLIMTSAAYQAMNFAGSFDKTRLFQAQVADGVSEIAILNYGWVQWCDPAQDYRGTYCQLLGFDLNPDFVPDVTARNGLAKISQKDTIMLDEWSHPDYGEKRIGKNGTLNKVEVTINALYKMGISFHAKGSAIVNLETFQEIARSDPREINFGLIKIAPGAKVEEVQQSLTSILPDDVLIFERNKLIKAEQDYFVNVKPIGIMFWAGAFIAFVVGAVILFQVLYTEFSNKLKEFATLKAVGFSNNYIYKIGATQSLLFAVVSYALALPLAHLVSFIAKRISHVPMFLPWKLALFVFFLSILMCVISGILALQKVRKADPASLF